MSWSFILTKKDQTPIGEITNVDDRSCKLNLSRGDQAGFKIRVDHEMVPYIFGEDTLLQVWQDDTIRFNGDILTTQFQSTEDNTPPTIAVTAANPWWRLTRRLCGLSNIQVGDVFGTQSKAKTAADLINTQNSYGATGVGTLGEGAYTSVGSLGTYTSGPYKKVSDAINELATGFDGFEWRLEPVTGHPNMASFVAANVFGSTRPDCIFEYGCGTHNVRNSSYLRDISNLTNWDAILPENTEPEAGEFAVLSEDATSRAEHGLMMELVENSGIKDGNLRQALVNEVINVKKNPRFVAGMTLDFVDNYNPGRVPTLGDDFWIGDIVQARAESYGVLLFNGYARVYGVEVKLDANGQEAVTPILINEGPE